MKKWEYWATFCDHNASNAVGIEHMKDKIARLGIEGWEMVGLTTLAGTSVVQLYFKRPLEE